jgi:hypothetical protein
MSVRTPQGAASDVPGNGSADDTEVEQLRELREVDFVNSQDRLDFPAGHIKDLLSAPSRWLLEKVTAKFRVRQ